ncbi:MAG: 1-aminocyclopropane-1-carboxylate deaminase/D-cysteine desulfhydrase [Bacteroidota bacterium]
MLNKILIQSISTAVTKAHQMHADCARFDLVHPIVSGNKYYKLRYYIAEAQATGKSTLVTMGGYYSNHLLALAFSAQQAGLASIGWVRGEQPKTLSPTLNDCISLGMELQFFSRSTFDELHADHAFINQSNHLFIPQGGFGRLGMMGAATMLDDLDASRYDILVAAAGTGTMAAGLISRLHPYQQLEIISVLKGSNTLEEDILSLLPEEEQKHKKYQIHYRFHEGGYARHTAALLKTMNEFYQETEIPTDFVYTGKMIKAFLTLASEEASWRGKQILLLHSGGLQGNRSLKPGELMY